MALTTDVSQMYRAIELIESDHYLHRDSCGGAAQTNLHMTIV